MHTDTKNELVRLREHSAVLLAEGDDAPARVQILRVGIFQHPYYGEMVITPQVLSDMVNNFDAKIRRQDLPIDYFHESDREAAGWFTKLVVEGPALFGEVNWTPKAKQMLKDKELRYFSADFYFEWTDPETGVAYKNVLNGGGLVNRPFVKDMKPVVELSEGNLDMKTVEVLTGEVKTLGEQITAKENEVKTLSEKVAAQATEISELKGKIALAEKEKAIAEKEAKFNELCTAGKACAAQKDAWMEGDMVKFAELSQPLNVVEKGGKGEEKVSQLSEQDKLVCEKLGLTEEEFAAANK